MSAIVIACARGAVLRALRGRNAWATNSPVWTLVAPASLPLIAVDNVNPPDALCDAILSDPPADAWRGTAEELASTIAPVVGRHCEACRGSGQLSDDDGTWDCDCTPPGSPVACVRGVPFGPQYLAALREILHTFAPTTACGAWLSAPLDFGQSPRGIAWGSHPILVVDIDGWRFSLAPLLSTDAARVEVTL